MAGNGKKIALGVGGALLAAVIGGKTGKTGHGNHSTGGSTHQSSHGSGTHSGYSGGATSQGSGRPARPANSAYVTAQMEQNFNENAMATQSVFNNNYRVDYVTPYTVKF